jgi:hypothetical protein
MAKTEDARGDVLSFCCGGKKCPVFTVENDGVVLRDAELLGDNSIKLTAEQATTLRAWLENKGF